MPARPVLRVKGSTTDDDVRSLASGIGLGAYRTTVRSGFARRVLLFEYGLVERRAHSIRISVDGFEPAAVGRLLESPERVSLRAGDRREVTLSVRSGRLGP